MFGLSKKKEKDKPKKSGGLIGNIIKAPFKMADETTKLLKGPKNVGLFDVGTRVQMTKTILGWKGKCPSCGGQLGINTCNKCGADVQELAAKDAKRELKKFKEIEIHGSIIKNPVHFLGGHKDVPDPTDGWLALLKNKIIFKNDVGEKFEIAFEKIKRIDIVDDKYTPSLARGLVMGALGGDTNSQSFRPHKSCLKITYDTGKRDKDLEFNFGAITWAGAVEECQKFYSKLNAILD